MNHRLLATHAESAGRTWLLAFSPPDPCMRLASCLRLASCVQLAPRVHLVACAQRAPLARRPGEIP
jgi:hypothetical protein